MKIFDFRGVQKRFVFLVAGSLAVLLLFTSLHAIFIAEKALDPGVFEGFKDVLFDSTWRLIGVGVLYIAVVTLAAMFLTHRAVGPIHRMEQELENALKDPKKFSGFQIREDDDMKSFISRLNDLLSAVKKHE